MLNVGNSITMTSTTCMLWNSLIRDCFTKIWISLENPVHKTPIFELRHEEINLPISTTIEEEPGNLLMEALVFVHNHLHTVTCLIKKIRFYIFFMKRIHL